MNTGTHPRRMHNSYEDEEERKHFQRIVSAFRYYRWVCLAAEPDRRRSLLSLTIRFLFLDLDVEDRHDRRRQTSSRFSALMPKSRGKGIINHSDSICKRLPFRGPPPPVIHIYYANIAGPTHRNSWHKGILVSSISSLFVAQNALPAESEKNGVLLS